jgi:t-SNARE complex subunit (syntaxin)
VIATVVDWHAILQVIWVSLLAGVGVTASYGFGLLGTTRAIEYARDGRAAEAVAYAAVAVVGLVIVVGAIVFGIVILTGD